MDQILDTIVNNADLIDVIVTFAVGILGMALGYKVLANRADKFWCDFRGAMAPDSPGGATITKEELFTLMGDFKEIVEEVKKIKPPGKSPVSA